MGTKMTEITKTPADFPEQKHYETASLYPGVELFYLTPATSALSLPHDAPSPVIQVSYCHAGQMEWKTGDGNWRYLIPESFSLYAGESCTDSALRFPTGQCHGLMLCIDLLKASARPPEQLRDTDFFRSALWDKCIGLGASLFPAANTQAKRIFSSFYKLPEDFRLPYQRIKALELLLYLAEMDGTSKTATAEPPSEQIKIVREIHDHLLLHMDRRVTIEELSRQYLINPTTLKAAFKSVYGTSIAAHVKEHRMEQAARLLKESDMSIAEIAQTVGYDSQSKFTVAFKSFFQVLPREYRKKLP